MREYYLKTDDARYKRNYTFMLHIYENHMYEFTYYYFLFLHLDKNETIRFRLDGSLMTNVEEIATYLALNLNRATLIVEEILENPYILALIAIKSGIDVVAGILKSKNKLEILKPLAKYTDKDLSLIISSKMSFWLLDNYTSYSYDTTEAKALFEDYTKFKSSIKLMNINDYILANDTLDDLYNRFIKLFNYNKIIEYRSGISATEQYYLKYSYNSDYVCQKYLEDNSIFDASIHTDTHALCVEQEILINELENEKKRVESFKAEIETLVSNIDYPTNSLRKKRHSAIALCILSLFAIVIGILTKFYNKSNISYVNFILLGLLVSGLAFVVFSLIKNTKQIKNREFLKSLHVGTELSLKTIEEEKMNIINDKKEGYETLTNLSKYEQNRNIAQERLKKLLNKPVKVYETSLLIGSLLLFIPALSFLNPFLNLLFDKNGIQLLIKGFDFNFINLIYFVIYVVVSVIFRKKNFYYYLVFVFLAMNLLISFIL